MLPNPCRNALSADKPTWLVINEQLQDSDLVLQTEAHDGDDFIPRDGFLLGSPLELAVNLYKDIQLKYHPHRKVGFLLNNYCCITVLEVKPFSCCTCTYVVCVNCSEWVGSCLKT